MIRLPFQIKNHGDLVFKNLDTQTKLLSISLKGIDFTFGTKVNQTSDIVLRDDKDKQNVIHINNIYEIKGTLIRFA